MIDGAGEVGIEKTPYSIESSYEEVKRVLGQSAMQCQSVIGDRLIENEAESLGKRRAGEGG